jgi:hypothetical protein
MSNWSFMEYSSGTGTSNPSNVYTQSAANMRQSAYPIPAYPNVGTTIIHTHSDNAIQNNEPGLIDLTTLVGKIAALSELKTIVPGDIFVKNSGKVTNADGSINTLWSDHIAIIAFVPSDPTITDPTAFMSQIAIIEAEFNGKTQNVEKNYTFYDYMTNEDLNGNSLAIQRPQ